MLDSPAEDGTGIRTWATSCSQRPIGSLVRDAFSSRHGVVVDHVNGMCRVLWGSGDAVYTLKSIRGFDPESLPKDWSYKLNTK